MTLSWKTSALLVIALFASACGASMKAVKFNVLEGGRQVEISRMFNDGFGADASANNAFKAVQKGDIPEATTMMQSEVALHPNNQFHHWDLAILYEAASQWDKAEAEMKECIRIDPKEKMYADELAFIANHKAALKHG